MFEKIKMKINSNEAISILCYCAGALFASVGTASFVSGILEFI